MRRREFLVSAGAATGAAMLPSRSSAAPVIKIGMIDSYSGALTGIATRHRAGAQFAVDRANRSGSVRHELITGDDARSPITGVTEAKRLISQEKVDVLIVGTSTAVTLAVSLVAQDNNAFALSMGSSAVAITGPKAKRVMFRFAPNTNMHIEVLGERILTYGKNWYFLVTDSLFGTENHSRLVARLKRGGGSEVGFDLVQQGASDYSSALGKLRNTNADGLILCQPSSDAVTAMKQFCEMGLAKIYRLAGCNLEDFGWKTLPCNELAGALFPMHWSPQVSDSAAKLAQEMQPKLDTPISARHYFGYQTVSQVIDRVHAAGTTDTGKLILAFEDHRFDAAKTNLAVWRGCDHQCAQDEYVGALLSDEKRTKIGSMFELRGSIGPASGGRVCSSDPDAAAAFKAIMMQSVGSRDSYVPVKI